MRDNWKIRELGDICNVSAGQGAPQGNDKYSFIGTPFVKAGDLSGLLQGQTEQDILQVSADVIKSHRLKVYPAGAILFAKSGMSCMKGYVYTLKHPCCVVSHLAILTPKSDSSSYLQYCLRHIKPNTLVKDPAYPSISLADISSMRIPVPPIAEQDRIVAELDCLTGIIEKKKKQLEELDNLAQSIFYDMFGDPTTNEKGWDVKKIGDVGKVITGSTPTTRDAENYSSNDYCFIKPGDIGKDAVESIEETEAHISTKAYLSSRQLPIGSILTTCIGIVGKVGITRKEATCNQQINAILPNDRMSSTYVAMTILLNRKILEAMANAPVVPIINKGQFSSIPVPFPPLDLQNEFAQKIEAIEKQKELVKWSIVETETLFNSRMDYWFNL